MAAAAATTTERNELNPRSQRHTYRMRNRARVHERGVHICRQRSDATTTACGLVWRSDPSPPYKGFSGKRSDGKTRASTCVVVFAGASHWQSFPRAPNAERRTVRVRSAAYMHVRKERTSKHALRDMSTASLLRVGKVCLVFLATRLRHPPPTRFPLLALREVC